MSDNENKIRKAFGIEPVKGEKKTSRKLSKEDDHSLVDSYNNIMKISKKIYKGLTKNKIPKSYEEVMTMKEKLEAEERQEIEKQDAIKIIKEIQARKKQKRIDIKKARRAKLRRFLRIDKL